VAGYNLGYCLNFAYNLILQIYQSLSQKIAKRRKLNLKKNIESELEKNIASKWLKILLGFALTVLALWLSFRKLDWKVLKNAILQINLFWVILAVANSIFTVYALGWRWQILLKPRRKIPLSTLFRLNIISQYFNIIIPWRVGELFRAFLASKKHMISGAYVIGTIAVEKIFDFFVFVIMWISIPAFLAMQKQVKAYKIALLLFLLSAFLLIFFIWKPRTVLGWTGFLSRILPGRLRQGVQDFIEKGIEAFGLLRNTKVLFFVVILTFAFVADQVLTNFLLFKAFNLNLSFWAGLFLLLALQVGNIPPSAPGKIGIFEYAVILALSVFNISKSQALSYGIILHLVAYLPKILLGLIFLPGLDLFLRKNSRAYSEK
jgi:uncharacterized protein (TIRG00374 family)